MATGHRRKRWLARDSDSLSYKEKKAAYAHRAARPLLKCFLYQVGRARLQLIGVIAQSVQQLQRICVSSSVVQFAPLITVADAIISFHMHEFVGASPRGVRLPKPVSMALLHHLLRLLSSI